eukprot:scaffold706_cov418-Prasinococcus_capsulatus_cf.AAC.10
MHGPQALLKCHFGHIGCNVRGMSRQKELGSHAIHDMAIRQRLRICYVQCSPLDLLVLQNLD